jgi:CubicO group peptidase (beta-lactamase class C family)
LSIAQIDAGWLLTIKEPSMRTRIEGDYDPGFAKVLDAFAENFNKHGELGAAAAVVVDGRLVVDIWGGHRDEKRTRPWTKDTLVNVYSTTKGLLAVCAHQLVSTGKLDLDAPVAKYWPEFAQAGKKDLPVRHLLNHRAGLPAISKPLAADALFDWNVMCSALAEQQPWWKPGEKHGYHAMTFGFLIGELIRRITGESPRDYLRTKLAAPLGADFQIGLSERDENRVAEIIAAPPPLPGAPNPLAALMSASPESVTAKTLANPPSVTAPGVSNSQAWRRAQLPAANGHGTARALAQVYGALSRGGEIGGVRLIAPEAIRRFSEEQSSGLDEVLLIPTRFSLGFMMSLPGASMGPGTRSFGHPGAGGSLGFADPDAKIGFGYIMNQMNAGILIDQRATALIDALYQSL